MKRAEAWYLLAFILIVNIASLGHTQTPNQTASPDPTTVIRDAQAVALVEQALGTLGGKSIHLQMRTAVISGTIQASDSTSASSFLWEDDLSGNMPEFHKEVRFGDSQHIFVSGHGKPSHQQNGVSRKLGLQVALAVPPLYLPGVVLARQLANPSYSLRFVGQSNGLWHIRTSWDLNPATTSFSTQDWYIDSSTILPTRVEYLLPSTQGASNLPASMDFSDFRTISGIAVPFKIIGVGPDQKSRTFTVSSAQINSTIDPTHFEISGGQQ